MDDVLDDSICYLHPVGLGSYNKHPNAILPVATDGNLYLNDALASRHEAEATVYENNGFDITTDPTTGAVKITVKDAGCFRGTSVNLVSTDVLGKSYHADMAYEKADGSPYSFDTDFFGNKRTEITPGPFEVMEDVVVEV